MSRNSKKNRQRRQAKRQRAAKARAHRPAAADRFDSPLVTIEPVHGVEQLESLLGAMDGGTDAPWTVRVIVSASGRQYSDGESIPLLDQEIIESHPVDTLDEAQALGEKLEAKIRGSDSYPLGARTSIMSAPEFDFGS